MFTMTLESKADFITGSCIQQGICFHIYSGVCAKQVTSLAFTDVEKQNVINKWCENILKRGTCLAGLYCYISNDLLSSAMRDGRSKFIEYYMLTHKIMPWADDGARQIVIDACKLKKFCDAFACSLMSDVQDSLKQHFYLKRLEAFAEEKVAITVDNALNEYHLMPKFEMSVVDYDQNKSKNAVELWAERLVDEILTDSRKPFTPLPENSQASKPGKSAYFSQYNFTSNNNNNNIVSAGLSGFPCYDAETSSVDECDHHEKYQSYAEEFVLDLCSWKNLKDSSILHQKSPRYESSESISISSDLSSPHSTADSRGLHHFADKLLYSLSILENRCSDFGSDLLESQTILKDYRRSSAPALLTSNRRASLRTVYEGDISENPGIGDLKMHPLTKEPRNHQIPLYYQRRHHSIEESSIRLKSVEDFSLTERDYSDTLAQNILCCAYKDFV